MRPGLVLPRYLRVRAGRQRGPACVPREAHRGPGGVPREAHRGPGGSPREALAVPGLGRALARISPAREGTLRLCLLRLCPPAGLLQSLAGIARRPGRPWWQGARSLRGRPARSPAGDIRPRGRIIGVRPTARPGIVGTRLADRQGIGAIAIRPRTRSTCPGLLRGTALRATVRIRRLPWIWIRPSGRPHVLGGFARSGLPVGIGWVAIT